jgi:drug/metabolite transporter (DMT)-like permease
LAEDVDQVTQIFARMVVACVASNVFCAAQRSFGLRRLRTGGLGLWPLIYIVTYPAMVFCFTAAVGMVALSVAVSSLFASSVLISSLGGEVLFRQRANVYAHLGAALCLTGLFLIWRSQSGLALPGAALAIGAGVFDGLGNLSRTVVSVRSGMRYVPAQFAAAAIVGVVAVLVFHESVRLRVTVHSVVLLASFGFLLAAVAYSLLFVFRHLTTLSAAPLLATELVFAAMFGWLFFGERQSMSQVIGLCAVALASVVVATRGTGVAQGR